VDNLLHIIIPVIRYPEIGVEYRKECQECLALGCWECDYSGHRQLTEDEEIAVYQMLQRHNCQRQ
jgi:hypothetical protein